MPTPTTSDILRHIKSLLHSCALSRSHPSLAHQLHSLLTKSNLIASPLLSSSLFHFYANHGPPSSSLLSFSLIPSPSLSSIHFTSLISSLSRHSLFPLSLFHFRSMLRSPSPSCRPDHVSLLTILSVAAKMSDLPFGTSVHPLLYKHGHKTDTKCYNTLMNMYLKCGTVTDAWKAFHEMDGSHNAVSISILLSGCIELEGIDKARKLFDNSTRERNEASWCVMVAGYVQSRRTKHAFQLLQNTDVVHFSKDSLCSILSACSQAGDLVFGRWVHVYVTKSNLRDVFVDTALIDMYSKSGRVDVARVVFETAGERNLVMYNATLNGLSMHGMGSEVVELFERMVGKGGVKPDHITFVSVLSACGRSGLVELGLKLFNDMPLLYGHKPRIEHYACAVDMLGRAGRLNEAEDVVRAMPMRPNEVVLGSLLASCGLHGRLEAGRRLMRELAGVDPDNTEYHVLLSNLYADHGRHAEADVLWQQVKRKGGKKGPGMSCIEIEGCVHRFSAGDRSHYRAGEVYDKLEEMVCRLRSCGYVGSDVCRGRVEEVEERERGLMWHSERLAVAFGLVAGRPAVKLRVFMNLRICSDCHAVMKLVSEVYRREIIIRDRNRFHTFREGVCSCKDYW